MVRKTGGFVYLEQAISKNIRPAPDLGPMHFVALGRPLDFFLREIEKLEAYPYTCMEQTASRLIALLAKKRISKAQNAAFHQNGDIKSLIRRLEKGQQESGAWGWWLEGRANLFMTAWVCHALHVFGRNGGRGFIPSKLIWSRALPVHFP